MTIRDRPILTTSSPDCVAMRYAHADLIRATYSNPYALIDTVDVAFEAWIAWVWRWIICSRKL